MFGKEYTYEVVDIDRDIFDLINKKLEEGKDIIENIKKQYSPDYMGWIKSFEQFIDIIDPNGNDYSNSLASKWYKARYYGGNYPENDKESKVVFYQYLGIVQSLLIGKVKIVKNAMESKHADCIFHKRDLPLQKDLVFVLMPFEESWSDYIWREEIKPIVQGVDEYSLICKRADDLFGRDVMQDIYESILTSSIVIADITNHNANVFYELGIAHALGKEVILLAQNAKQIPFDLNRFRHCIYSNDEMGYKKLRQYIPEAIRDIFKKEEIDEL